MLVTCTAVATHGSWHLCWLRACGQPRCPLWLGSEVPRLHLSIADNTACLQLLSWRAGTACNQLLDQLTEILHTLVLPKLGLADLQALGQACRTTQAIVASLPDAALRQLAQVWSSDQLLYRMMHAQQSECCPVVQAEHLPAGEKGSLRQQLHSWARHAAAVRAGGLHLATEVLGCPNDIYVSPKLDAIAVQHTQGKNHFYKLVPLPTAVCGVDMYWLLQAKLMLQHPASQDCHACFFPARCGPGLTLCGHAQQLDSSRHCIPTAILTVCGRSVVGQTSSVVAFRCSAMSPPRPAGGALRGRT